LREAKQTKVFCFFFLKNKFFLFLTLDLPVATEPVIYPGALHDLTRPSFLVDRMQRYLAWYDWYMAR